MTNCQAENYPIERTCTLLNHNSPGQNNYLIRVVDVLASGNYNFSYYEAPSLDKAMCTYHQILANWYLYYNKEGIEVKT